MWAARAVEGFGRLFGWRTLLHNDSLVTSDKQGCERCGSGTAQVERLTVRNFEC